MYKLFSPQQRSRAIEAVRTAPEHYVVEIKERTRSLDQNALLWRLLTITSKQVPWTVNGHDSMLSPEDWKDVFTASLHQELRIAKGIQGGFVMLGRSTSKMTVSQMTAMIEFIYSFLSEQGIEVDVSEQEIIGDRQGSTMHDVRL
jgi:hypothetical protein